MAHVSPNNFRDPDLFCKKCGRLIPRNGVDVDGVDRKAPLMGCLECARAAGPPRVVTPKRRKGESDPDQAHFLNGPGITIT